MRVPNLNDFIRKAGKAGILHSLKIDFKDCSAYRMGSGLLTVASVEGSYRNVQMVDEFGTTFYWGLDSGSESVEITSVKFRPSRVGIHGKVTLVKLGRKCDPSGVI